MDRPPTLVAIFCFWISALGAMPAHRPPHNDLSYCLYGDTSAAIFLARMQEYGASTDPAFVTMRKTLNLPSVAQKSQVVTITDDAKCSRASHAIDSAGIAGVPAKSRVYLVAIGTHYMAQPSMQRASIVHLNTTFSVLNTVGPQ